MSHNNGTGICEIRLLPPRRPYNIPLLLRYTCSRGGRRPYASSDGYASSGGGVGRSLPFCSGLGGTTTVVGVVGISSLPRVAGLSSSLPSLVPGRSPAMLPPASLAPSISLSSGILGLISPPSSLALLVACCLLRRLRSRSLSADSRRRRTDNEPSLFRLSGPCSPCSIAAARSATSAPGAVGLVRLAPMLVSDSAVSLVGLSRFVFSEPPPSSPSSAAPPSSTLTPISGIC